MLPLGHVEAPFLMIFIEIESVSYDFILIQGLSCPYSINKMSISLFCHLKLFESREQSQQFFHAFKQYSI